jgi:hypothetical protein
MNPAVDALLDSLDLPLRGEIDLLRAIILRSDPSVVESVKWNGPSFATVVDFAAIRLRPLTSVSVVLHTGAKVRPEPLKMQVDAGALKLKWATPDRCQVMFTDLAGIQAGEEAFLSLLRQWQAKL